MINNGTPDMVVFCLSDFLRSTVIWYDLYFVNRQTSVISIKSYLDLHKEKTTPE